MPATEAPCAPPVLLRAASLVVFTLSCVAAMNAYGTAGVGCDWLAAWVAASALYSVAGVGLWRGEAWARNLALGMVTWGLLAWVQSTFVGLGGHPLIIGVIGGHGLAVVLLAFAPAGLERRHRWSLVLAGAALPGALMYGFAPLAELTTRVLLVGGAALLFSMAMGIARGRTWGLLAAAAAVPMLCAGAFVAPPVVSTALMHPLLPAGVMPHGMLLIRFLGISAGVLALASVLPFAGPIVRFVRR